MSDHQLGTPGLMPTPIEVTDDDLLGWQSRPGMWFGFARQWSRYAPRGKGAVPRSLRKLYRGRRCTIGTEHGAVLTVAPVALDTAATIWARGGVYEPWVVDACVALLRSGETFYDIGANIGLVATEVAQQVPDAELICFEPQHELAWHLAVSARLNGFRMMVFPTLLNDQSEVGEEKLYVPAHSIHASIVSRDARARAALAPAISLDALADHHALQPPDVVKMDVEGAELLVAKGARESLRRRPASLVFESDVNMQRFGYERSELFGLLLEIADYQFWFIPEDRSGPIAVRSVPVPRGLNGNYVALAPQHRGRLAGC